MTVDRWWARTPLAVVAVALVLLFGGCVRGDVRNTSPDSITVWIIEDLPDRVAATQTILDAFTASSGVTVKLVPVAEDQFNQLLLSSAAAGTLPDVIGGVPLSQVRTLSSNELIDVPATSQIVQKLDAKTFSARALELTRAGSDQLAVPSESWTQVLLYRKDLFEQAGLPAPTSYDRILAAARELNTPDRAGFIGATAAGDGFTDQTFESLALANGCQLVNDAGEVTFDSPPCVNALRFYGELVRDYSVPGAQDVDTTRATYFAGKSAMTVWSTFILDELAGLREDAKPTCPECADDPTFLAKNTGIVSAVSGPDGAAPTVYGEITSWVVTASSSVTPSQRLIEYMMTDGYQPWIAIAPEGKVPVRTGTAKEPSRYSDLWPTLPVGVDTRAPLSRFYSRQVIDEVAAGPGEVSRWAIPQGQGDLLGAIQGELPVGEAVNQVANGTDPAEAARQAAAAVVSIQESVE